MPDTVADGDGWDVFVSFASPDHAKAEELHRLLERQGKKVFLSSESIHAGSTWKERLSRSLSKSRLIAVLLSEHTADAHFQEEEIQWAIRLRRAGKLQIIPVYVNGPPRDPQDWEFGLQSFNRLDLKQLGPETTADRIGEQLADATSPPPLVPEPRTDSTERQSVGDLLHGAALRIDRTQQWLPVVETCQSDESAIFLLHGPRRQNLDLFVSRISIFLDSECKTHHRPVGVPMRVEYSIPRNAAEWENRVRLGLAGEGGSAGTAADLLREEARSHPVFLVISRIPIARRHVPGDGGLDDIEIEALQEFLGNCLPSLIATASEGRHPIRALLATHYETKEESLVEALDEGAYRGCEAKDLRFVRLPAVRPLEWSDIRTYLNLFKKRPPDRIYQELKAAFERLQDDESLEFRDILALLARVLGH